MSTPLIDLYQIRIFYLQQSLTHRFQTWVKPLSFTTVPTGLLVDYDLDAGAGSIDAETWVDALLAVYKGLFNATTQFLNAELWAYEANSDQGEFLAAGEVSVVGTNAGAAQAAGQTIFVGKTTTGRVKKFTAEEGSNVPGVPVTWNAVSGANGAWGAFVLGNVGDAMCDRAGGNVVALRQLFPGQNEATFKKRFRQLL